ncbi:MAG: hypothetical protein LBR10_01780 [Prevotellaceae bacterium]|nr:hypothetical protein [Prevotellaceae bacterium]
MKTWLLLFVLAVFCFGTTKAQIEITLDIEPQQDTIVIGDQITLKVSVVSPKNDVIFFPDFEKELVPGIELIEAKGIDTLKSKDTEVRRMERKYLITSFDEGSYILNRFPVFKLTASGLDTIYSNKELALSVKTIDLSENFEPYDIKEIKTYPSRWWLTALFILAGLILLMPIIAIIIIIATKAKKRRALMSNINPFEWARDELEKLKTSNLAVTRPKDYYSKLTDIVREYIELIINISMMEKTSDEILSVLPDTVFNPPHIIKNVEDLFAVADLVKFAKYQASVSECETSWQDASNFVIQSNIIINELKKSENEEDSGNSGDSEHTSI